MLSAPKILMALAAFGAACFSASNTVGATAPVQKQVKVLGIGNSFLGNASSYCEKLNAADPTHQLKLTQANIGGCSLEKHYRLAMIHEQKPEDPAGTPYRLKGKKVSLKDLLQADQWDYVTIQQVSNQSDDIKSYRPYAAQLQAYIKKYCPKAEIVVYEVWADRIDNSRMKRKNKTQADMYRDLSHAYRTIAKELGNLKVIPVGDAFQNARQVWNYQPPKDFKPEKMNYPDLPDQKHTLCIGWMWGKDKSGKQKIRYDHHANANGKLLIGLVWREFFLGVDSRKSTYRPAEVSEEDAVFLRKMAHETVANGLKPDLLKK